MTTLQQIELRCPICDTRFRSQAVVSTNSFGGKRTDFHERAAGTQPLPYLVHMCSRCGYAGSEKDFTEEAEITPTLREHVWNELAPKLHQSVLGHQQHGGSTASASSSGSASSASSASLLGGQGSAPSGQGAQTGQTGTTGAVAAMVAVPGSEKYEAAARVAEWAGAEPRQVADLLLRAAWCCVDEGDVEAERYFRRRAAWAFEQALSAYDGVAREERAVLTYLVGELWRRVGDQRQARGWFEQVAHELTDAQSQQWVLDASRQQKDAPREWFG